MFKYIKRYRPILIAGCLLVMAVDAFLNQQAGTGLIVLLVAICMLVYAVYSYTRRRHERQRHQARLSRIQPPPTQQQGLFVPPRPDRNK